jgi:hypothetical protein
MPRPSKQTKLKNTSIACARSFRTYSSTPSLAIPSNNHDQVSVSAPSSPMQFNDVEIGLDDDSGGMVHDSSSECNSDDRNAEDNELSELEGEGLCKSLRVRIEGKIKEFESLGVPQHPAYETIMRNISTGEWQKAESNRAFGYNGLSKRTQRRHHQEVREADEKNKVLQQS